MKTEKYILLLKKFYAIASAEFAKAIEDVACLYNNLEYENGSEEAIDHSMIISKFQGIDTLEQRIIHIIYAQEKVKRLYFDNRFKESFLRLQYFQFSIIAYDLFDSVSAIEAELHLERRSSIRVFTRRSELLKLTEEIKNSITDQCGDTKLILPITEQQVQICMQLYTMASERIVLNWFLNNMPEGQLSDLLDLYLSLRNDKGSKSTELF